MTENPTISVTSGLLRGRTMKDVAAFKGIPYGDCGGGLRRWQRARPVAPWEGVRDAGDYGPRAIQPESREMKVTSDEIEALMVQGGPADDAWRKQSEDCLTLNVWTPDPSGTRKLPVLFWCHGGKYFGETPPVWWFDGEALAAREDVVVVTVRHRVGVLGFLDIAGLPGSENVATTPNVGMLDLVDALTWVRDNIAKLGGNPGNVTIFGESGGGLKVSVLLGMPAAEGLFHKAIIQSGAQMEAQSRSEATENALALMAELGLEPHEVERLFEVPPQELVEAQVRLAPSLVARPTGRLVEFEPVVDGVVLPDDCLDPARCPVSRSVPLLVGNCATETTFFMSALPGWREFGEGQLRGMIGGMLGTEAEQILALYAANRPDATPTDLLIAITGDFIFRRKAIAMAEQKSEQGAAAVYMYVLAFETDVHDGSYQTPHILDLPLVFAHPDHPILGSDLARRDVSRQMSGAWAAFARTGKPSHALLPAWPAYDAATRATMFFAEHPRLIDDPRADERAAWATSTHRPAKELTDAHQL